MSENRRLLAGTLMLLVACFLRLWQFDSLPPGLQHDEVFKAEEALRLANDGDFRLFYPSNQGHEGGFVWLLGLSYLIVGANALMIKLPAFVCGLLTVALVIRFGFRAYSPLVGLIAGGMTAASFWHIFVSRVGLRAGMLPLVVLLVMLGLWRLLEGRRGRGRWLTAALTGIALGFAIYTYTASLALYLAFAAFALALPLIRPDLARRLWREFLLVAGITGLLVLPMIQLRLGDPIGVDRAASISDPLQAALGGHPQSLIDNGVKLLGMPAFVGDPSWRYNVSGRPLFLLPIGLLVYAGFFIALRGVRPKPVNLLLILVALFSLVPSLLTTLAPSFLRSLGALPPLMLFIGIAASALERVLSRRSWIGWAFAAFILAATAIADYHAYFAQWAPSRDPNLRFHAAHEQGDSVGEIYRGDLKRLAAYLGEHPDRAAFASTPNARLDPALFRFSAGVGQPQVVFFDGFANIPLSLEPALLFVSPLSPISAKHQPWLSEPYASRRGEISLQGGALAFDVYEIGLDATPLRQTLADAETFPVYFERGDGFAPLRLPIQFGNQLRLLGLTVPRTQIHSENDGVNNQLYFETLVERTGEALNVFMHLISAEGELMAQRDLLGVPAANWRQGMIFAQDNFVPIHQKLAPGAYRLYLGLYNWRTGLRLPVLDERGQAQGERLYLGEITVIDRPD